MGRAFFEKEESQYYVRDKVAVRWHQVKKPTKSALAMMPDARMELPYEGAKEMFLVDDVDNSEFLRELLEAMYEELPAPKKK